MNAPVKIETTLKDWETDQEVRWCPGCGDYAILKAVQRTLPKLGADPAKTVFISGSGGDGGAGPTYRFPIAYPPVLEKNFRIRAYTGKPFLS